MTKLLAMRINSTPPWPVSVHIDPLIARALSDDLSLVVNRYFFWCARGWLIPEYLP
jgi:hypothetical protein